MKMQEPRTTRLRWTRWGTGLVALALLTMAGCGWFDKEEQAAPVVEDNTTRLGTKTDISLKAWLQLSREELAKKAAALEESVQQQYNVALDNRSSLFLSEIHPPRTFPVFEKLAYTKELGLSVPPYYDSAKPDAQLALHYARFGDVDAALKLTSDANLQAKLRTFRGEKNYPVEWTHLTALNVQAAQLKLLNGQIEGATELVLMHQQLQELLDVKAARGPLGDSLFPSGHFALVKAMEAWRTPENNKPTLANDIEAALKSWTKPKPAPAALPFGSTRDEVAAFFQTEAVGRTVAVNDKASVARAVDLLALSVLHEDVRGVVAFFDDQAKFGELRFIYRGGVNEFFPDPKDLAYSLLDRGLKGKRETTKLPRDVFVLGSTRIEATLVPRSSVIGGVIRVTPTENAPRADLPENPLQLGLLRVDRSFEQTRRRFTAHHEGTQNIDFESPQAMKALTLPVKQLVPIKAVVQRAGTHDLIESIAFLWAERANVTMMSFEKILLPLWSAYGPSELRQTDANQGNPLEFRWEEGTTEYTLRLPYTESDSPILTVADRRSIDNPDERTAEVARVEQEERLQRWANNTMHTRLPRTLHIDRLQLGMSKKIAESVLPQSNARASRFEDGVSVLLLGKAPRDATHWAQQLFVQFDKDDNVGEIRVRYREGPKAPSAKSPGLYDSLKQTHGVPETLPAPWSKLWPDLPAKIPAPFFCQWVDDRTILTFQRDSGGVELVLRDRPRDQSEGVSLAPLQFCSEGVLGCELGDTKQDVYKRWQIGEKPIVASDGALVLVQPADSTFDVILVYFEDDKVSRLVGRHRAKPADKFNVTPELQKYWSSNIDQLGSVRRTDKAKGLDLQGFGWNDDRTRVRAFGRLSDKGSRIFTEWRQWPFEFVPTTTTAKK